MDTETTKNGDSKSKGVTVIQEKFLWETQEMIQAGVGW